jgi:RNase P/RNase MRP subunit POP5
MKLKLKPTDREKVRYLLIEESTKEEIERVILEYIGILGWAKAGVNFVEDFNDRKKVILSVNRKEVDKIKAAFAISKEKVNVKKISGTLKGLGIK